MNLQYIKKHKISIKVVIVDTRALILSFKTTFLPHRGVNFTKVYLTNVPIFKPQRIVFLREEIAQNN